MHTINDAVTFMQHYLDLEFASSVEAFERRARFDGPPNALMPPLPAGAPRPPALAAFEALAAEGHTIIGGRYAYRHDPVTGTFTHLTSRGVLFAVTEHAQEKGAATFTAFLNNRGDRAHWYGGRYFLTEMYGALRVTGVTGACSRCETTGVSARGKCGACKGVGWIRDPENTRRNYHKLGRLIGVVKLTPPGVPAHRAHYDALGVDAGTLAA